MPTKQRVLIIVPAYNEAPSLPGLLEELQDACPECHVVVIDDGSTDQTRAVVRQSAARLVSLPCNLGIGGAVQTGFKVALQGGYDVAIQVDGDGQHPPREIPKLLEAMRETNCDLVVGSRFRTHNGFQSSLPRRIGIKLFSWLLSILCHAAITDATSGFRAIGSRAIEVLARHYAEDYPEVEALLVVHRAGLQIAEVPVDMLARASGKSSIGILQGLSYMVKVTLTIVMNLLRKRESV